MNKAKLLKEARRILSPLDLYSKSCHSASIRLVKALGTGRVARGFCKGVPGQHSWVVMSLNCYDPKSLIIDPTLWSYDKNIKGIWSGTIQDGKHRPHGIGSIWNYGRPPYPKGEEIALTPKIPLSANTLYFLDLVGPLDREGWDFLAAHCPVEDWPAAEIIAAIEDTKALSALVPIDRIGMLTDRNPGGLYLP